MKLIFVVCHKVQLMLNSLNSNNIFVEYFLIST